MATPTPAAIEGQDSTTSNGAGQSATSTSSTQQSQVNGEAKALKQPPDSSKSPPTGKDAPIKDGEVKLSNVELKKRAKAEKAARRAAEKAAAGIQQSGPSGQQPVAPALRLPGSKEPLQSPKTLDIGKHQKRSGSTGQGKSLPLRQSGAPSGNQGAAEVKQKKLDQKKVSIFGHLYGQPRRTSMAGAGKEDHPAVIALGLQMRDYVICGSNARCVAMLLCFKRVGSSGIEDSPFAYIRRSLNHILHPQGHL